MRVCEAALPHDRALWHSLSIIRSAQNKLNFLTSATPASLESRIELCNVLLCKISDVQSSLAERLRSAR